MKTVLTKWGNSVGIRIPKHLVKEINFIEGEELDLKIINDSILIKKQKNNLEKLLSQITHSNVHKETDTSNPLGKELW